jgi:hypothetical protein
MKKYFLSLYLLCFVATISVAQQNKTQWVVGNWKVEKLEFLHYDPLLKQATPEKKKQYEEELKALAQNSAFQFKNDGTYLIQFSGIQEVGKWKLNQYASKLIKEEKLPSGQFQKPDEVGIETLTKNTMVLLNDYPSGEIVRIFLKK